MSSEEISESYQNQRSRMMSNNDQLTFDGLFNHADPPDSILPELIADLKPVVPTVVYKTFWYFAAERQSIFFSKAQGCPPPWTDDQILTKYKFTNAYRASDRVSQYLIRNVIYQGDQSVHEIFFRIILFKIFNKISTWELLTDELGEVRYSEYSFEKYDHILTRAIETGRPIFSAAYIMPSGKNAFGNPKKHRNFLELIELLMDENVPVKISNCKSMKCMFELLSSYPMLGDFLAYQFAIDLNYSNLTNFSESEFVVPGPGARDGIRKCFSDFGGLNEIELIHLVTDRQEAEFKRLGLRMKTLWGRPLQLIDCQNLFCEVAKYSRVAHPSIQGVSGRKRIKQKYSSARKPIRYWYPPKWGINELIMKGDPDDEFIFG